MFIVAAAYRPVVASTRLCPRHSPKGPQTVHKFLSKFTRPNLGYGFSVSASCPRETITRTGPPILSNAVSLHTRNVARTSRSQRRIRLVVGLRYVLDLQFASLLSDGNRRRVNRRARPATVYAYVFRFSSRTRRTDMRRELVDRPPLGRNGRSREGNAAITRDTYNRKLVTHPWTPSAAGSPVPVSMHNARHF